MKEANGFDLNCKWALQSDGEVEQPGLPCQYVTSWDLSLHIPHIVSSQRLQLNNVSDTEPGQIKPESLKKDTPTHISAIYCNDWEGLLMQILPPSTWKTCYCVLSVLKLSSLRLVLFADRVSVTTEGVWAIALLWMDIVTVSPTWRGSTVTGGFIIVLLMSYMCPHNL